MTVTLCRKGLTAPKINFAQSRGKVKREIMEAAADFFKNSEDYSKSQKKLLRQRISAIADQACENLNLKSLPCNRRELRKFYRELSSIVIQVGPALKLPHCDDASPELKVIYRKLLHGKFSKGDFIQLMKPALISALVIRRNSVLIDEARNLFKNILKEISGQLNDLATEEEEFFAEAIVGNILSYCTYFGPEDGESISIPQLIDGDWKMVEYTIERIYLTPGWMGSPITAFGLKPNISEGVSPLLLFKGTTFLTDDGGPLSLFCDLNPFASVGSYGFQMGKRKLEEWMKDACGESGCKVKVFGQSLGGALTLHTAVNLSEYVESAFAYAPTALLPHEIRSWNERFHNKEELPEVHIFYQENDAVPLAGLSWGEGWKIYKIFASKKKNFLFSHMQCYLAHKKNLVLRANPEMDQKKVSRIVTATTHLTLSIPLFFAGAFIYGFYLVVRKIIGISKSSMAKETERNVFDN